MALSYEGPRLAQLCRNSPLMTKRLYPSRIYRLLQEHTEADPRYLSTRSRGEVSDTPRSLHPSGIKSPMITSGLKINSKQRNSSQWVFKDSCLQYEVLVGSYKNIVCCLSLISGTEHTCHCFPNRAVLNTFLSPLLVSPFDFGGRGTWLGLVC